MTNEYFIEKRRLPVELQLVSGERVGGDLFIQLSWRGLSVLEDAPEYMNAPEPFFPILLADGGTRLFAKSQVILMQAPTEPRSEEAPTLGEPADVTILLTNGEQVSGRLLIEAIAPNTRVLDFLNRGNEPFITLHVGDRDVLVNRTHIVSVTNDGDGAA